MPLKLFQDIHCFSSKKFRLPNHFQGQVCWTFFRMFLWEALLKEEKLLIPSRYWWELVAPGIKLCLKERNWMVAQPFVGAHWELVPGRILWLDRKTNCSCGPKTTKIHIVKRKFLLQYLYLCTSIPNLLPAVLPRRARQHRSRSTPLHAKGCHPRYAKPAGTAGRRVRAELPTDEARCFLSALQSLPLPGFGAGATGYFFTLHVTKIKITQMEATLATSGRNKHWKAISQHILRNYHPSKQRELVYSLKAC